MGGSWALQHGGIPGWEGGILYCWVCWEINRALKTQVGRHLCISCAAPNHFSSEDVDLVLVFTFSCFGCSPGSSLEAVAACRVSCDISYVLRKGLGPYQCAFVSQDYGVLRSQRSRAAFCSGEHPTCPLPKPAKGFVLSFFPLVLATSIMTACLFIRASCGALIITCVLQGPLTEMHKHFSNLSVLGFDADVELNTVDLLS